MSVIVFCPKTMTFVSDSFVLDTKDLPGGFREAEFNTVQKIFTSECGQFVYCFEGTRIEEMVPVVLNYLLRFEKNLLTDKDKPPHYEKETFELAVMTKRRLYRFKNMEGKSTVAIRKMMFTNVHECTTLMHVLDLPAIEVWKEMLFITDTYHDQIPQVVTNKHLKLIPVKKTKSTEKKA